MREAFVHSRGVEIPHRCSAHNIQPEWSVYSEIHGGVKLLHEPGLLGPRLDATADRNRPDEALHEELAREREDDGIEADEGKVASTFAILDGCSGVCARLSREGVREKNCGGERILGRRVGEVERENKNDQREWKDPGVSHTNAFVFGEGAPYRAALRTATRLLALCTVNTLTSQSSYFNIQWVRWALEADSLTSRTQVHWYPPAAQRPIHCFSADVYFHSFRSGFPSSTRPFAAMGKVQLRQKTC